MASGKIKVVSDEYKSALLDLTFNSKPMINVLTMLAEENSDYGQVIVQVISDRIKQVNVDQKMPALYLLDSILKNIGGEYVNIISKHIVDTFCHVFESAMDERKRMQLFKLRNTWTQYIPNKTLYELDVRISRTDPNWPVASPAVVSSQNANPKIHVNPKFLQKSESPKIAAPAITPHSEKTDTGATKLQSKITKQRLIEEEKRVQEQLKLLQAEKLKRDREQHEMELKQQQLQRERLLSEQKRQLEVLRKQQQSMTGSDQKKHTASASTQQKITKTQNDHVVVKDPRTPKPNISDPRLAKSIAKSTSPPELNTKATVDAPPPKITSPTAVTVLNKIMTSLTAKKTKPSLQQLAKNKNLKESRAASKSRVSPVQKSSSISETSKTTGKVISSEKKNSVAVTTVTQVVPVVTPVTSIGTTVTSSVTPVASFHVTSVVTTTSNNTSTNSTPPPPSTFTQLSSRDMQIAAQAAAIATAMHQMRSGNSSPMGPEQSALIAAQLIKVMQDNAENSTLGTTSVTTNTLTSSVSETTASLSDTTSSSENTSSKPVVTTEQQNSTSTKPRLTSPKDEFGRDIRPDHTSNKRGVNQRDRSPSTRKSKNYGERSAPFNKDGSRSPNRNGRQRYEGRGRERKFSDSGRGELNHNRSKESQDFPERSRKARARSPSRYYCRVEKKIEVDKRVERKEKELVLQRIRKTSEGDKDTIRRLSETLETGNSLETEIDKELDDIELPEVGEQSKTHKKEEAPAVETLAGVKPEKMTQQEWEELQKIRKKECIILQTKIMDLKRKKEEKSPIDPAVIIRLKDEIQAKFKEGKLSTVQTDDLSYQIDQVDLFGKGRITDAQEHLHWRARNDMQHGLTPQRQPGPPGPSDYNERFPCPPMHNNQTRPPHPTNLRGGPTQPHMRGPMPQQHRPHMRDGPMHIREGPPPMREGPTHMIEGPPHMREGPSHMRDGPMHMREGPPHMRDGPPHMREGPPHMREGPPHMREGPPHMRDGPPHMREGPLHIREGPPHMREGPPHMRDGQVPPNMRDGQVPPNMRDGPVPPHMREGLPHLHMRDGPPHPQMNDGPPPNRREGPHMPEGPPPHMREGPPHMNDRPPHMREGPPHMNEGPPHMREGPPHMNEGPPPQHLMDGSQPPLIGPPGVMPQRMEGPIPPPHMMERPQLPPHMMEGGMPMHEGPRPAFHGPQYFRDNTPPPNVPGEGFAPSFHDNQPQFYPEPVPQPLDVNNLLGQLFASGILSNNQVEPPQILDLNAPLMKLQIDQLRRRHQTIINHLFQGMQCSSCGQRFPDEAKKQYSDHLDWHFRQNRKEKDGVRKVSSRIWYYDVHDWITHTEEKVNEEGKVQSAFFEAERPDKSDDAPMSTLESPMKTPSKRRVNDHSIEVIAGDDGVCSVCMENLEQYWDEDREGWRYKEALRENDKTYHRYCYTDYVPFEFEEVTTPTATANTPSMSPKIEQDVEKSILETSNVIIEKDIVPDKSINVKQEISEDNSKKTLNNDAKTVGESSSGHATVNKIKKESISEENVDLIDMEAPDSPEYPVMSSAAPQTISSSVETIRNTSLEQTIGIKRSHVTSNCDIPVKEIKLEADENDLYTSFETNNKIIMPSVTQSLSEANKSGSEAN